LTITIVECKKGGKDKVGVKISKESLEASAGSDELSLGNFTEKADSKESSEIVGPDNLYELLGKVNRTERRPTKEDIDKFLTNLVGVKLDKFKGKLESGNIKKKIK